MAAVGRPELAACIGTIKRWWPEDRQTDNPPIEETVNPDVPIIEETVLQDVVVVEETNTTP